MFWNNILAIVIGSFGFLIISFFIHLEVMATMMLFILNVLAYIDYRLLKTLKKIDQSDSSYEYLKSFKSWMIEKTDVNVKMARILYPYTFLALVLGFWFVDVNGNQLGEILRNKLLEAFPNTLLIMGIPAWFIALSIFVMVALAILGSRIYKFDVGLVYGGIYEKLDELLEEMEELRK